MTIIDTDLISSSGLSIDCDVIVDIPPSYLVEGNEVKAVLRGVISPEDITGDKEFKFLGCLEISAKISCDKCLKEVLWSLSTEIREMFSNENPESWAVADNKIDFIEVLRANICALLPMKILCNDTCLGLCPICGKNLNKDSCGCEKPLDSRFAALSSFFKEEV
ncbi:MAG: DUF177 domain-containing protein [Defluviitaleaceae bacterium]|nr:DUF177 domain-containing protein [Defluviitaleaceae bacterium]